MLLKAFRFRPVLKWIITKPFAGIQFFLYQQLQLCGPRFLDNCGPHFSLTSSFLYFTFNWVSPRKWFNEEITLTTSLFTAFICNRKACYGWQIKPGRLSSLNRCSVRKIWISQERWKASLGIEHTWPVWYIGKSASAESMCPTKLLQFSPWIQSISPV